MKPVSWIACLSLAGVAFLMGSPRSSNGQPLKKGPIIQDYEVPIGPLGFPMGTYLTIEGTVIDRVALRAGQMVEVDTVNGQRLVTSMPMFVENMHGVRGGTRCTLKGYEMGSMVGLPPALEQALKEAGKDNVGAQAVWGFQWNFVATSVVAPKGVTIDRGW